MHLGIRAPNWVGDLVMATPVLRAALADPRVERVSILVRRPLAALLEGGALEPALVPLASSGEELERWRSLAPDAALLLSNSFGAAWRARRARVPIRAGSALSGRGRLLTHRVVPPTADGRRVPIPTAHLLRDVAGLVGLSVPDLHPRLDVSDEERSGLRAQLGELGLGRGERFVLCCPGAAYGASKLWAPERFAQVLRAICGPRGWWAVTSGGPGEEPLLDAVARDAETGAGGVRALSLARVPRDLRGLIALAAEAELVLVGDSGPRWVAAAFDVPCVTVMGPNFPELTATSLEHAIVVRRSGLECAPCLERTCPLGHRRCMTELMAEPVIAAAEELLLRAAAGEGA